MSKHLVRSAAAAVLLGVLTGGLVAAAPSPVQAIGVPAIAPGSIDTVAGSVGAGPSLALPQRPLGLAVTPAGVLVGDQSGVVRLLDPVGHTQTVVAGLGVVGHSGDGGPAVDAMIRSVADVSVDGAGNVLLASGGAVRSISAAQVISTRLGHDLPLLDHGVFGVAVDANGDVYYSRDVLGGTDEIRVRRGDVDEKLVDVSVAGDIEVAGDGSLYWVDKGASTVGRRSPDGTVTIVAGTGVEGYNGDGIAATTAMLDRPTGIALDGADVLIADTDNRRLRRVSAGTISTIAGTGASGDGGDGGDAVDALITPSRVAVGSDGTVYVSTSARVRAIAPDQTIDTVAGTGASEPFAGDDGPATAALLDSPRDVFGMPDGSVLVTDRDNHRLRRVSADGTISTIAGNGVGAFGGDGGDPLLASLFSPEGVVATASGDIYVADRGNKRVRRITGGVITTVAGTGTAGYDGDGAALLRNLDGPAGLALDLDGSLLIADVASRRVRRLAGTTLSTVAGSGATSGSLGGVGPALSARLGAPVDVAVAPGGDLFIADTAAHRVRRVRAGTISTVAGNGSCDSLGDGGLATLASVCSPVGVAVADDSLLVTSAGVSELTDPTPPPSSARVRAIQLSSPRAIRTIAGTGVSRLTGDRGPAVAAELVGPSGLGIDVDGGLLIADSGARRVRKIVPPDVPAAPTGVVAIAGDGTAVVSWTAPTGDGGAPVEAYTVTASPGGASCTWSVPGPLQCTVSGLVNGTSSTFTVHATNVSGDGPESAPSTAVIPAVNGPRYEALTGYRLLDTRDGTGGFSEPFHAGLARKVVVQGGPVPTKASAVVLTVTAILPSESTHITIWPDGEAKPLASNLNVAAGDVRANTVIATLSADGAIDVVSNSGEVHLVIDVTGFFVPGTDGGTYAALTPDRLIDSRDGTGGFTSPWGAGTSRVVTVTGGPVPGDATAVVLTVTAINPSATSHLTLWAAGRPRPLASNLNVAPGDVIANTVVATVGVGGGVSVFNNSGSVHLAIDVTGYFRDTEGGAVYEALSPSRIVDSRDGTGGYATAWGPGVTRPVAVTGAVVPADAVAVVGTVTGILPSAATHLTLSPGGQPRPEASNLNLDPHEVVANTVFATVGAAGSVDVYNNSGEINVAIDLTGYFRP